MQNSLLIVMILCVFQTGYLVTAAERNDLYQHLPASRSSSEQLQFAPSIQQMQQQQKPDDFVVQMCRERISRLDWKKILKPCMKSLTFGNHIYRPMLRTNPSYTVIFDESIKVTGEYSSFKIRTYDNTNVVKTFGGDTIRVFLNGTASGTASLEPYVYDLENGEYETSFLLLEPGMYSVTVILEGSLCSSYVNPPMDWFRKGDYNGHFQNEWDFKRKKGWPYLLKEHMWDTIENFWIDVKPGNNIATQENLNKIRDWQAICKLDMACNFLEDGFGRWVNFKWKPFVNDIQIPKRHNKKARKQEGLLWIYGDCYAYHLFEKVWNGSLCNKEFRSCQKTYNWVYPRKHVQAEKDWTVHLQRHFDLDIPWLVDYFKRVITRPELRGPENGMLLNLGLHFVRSATFEQYKELIDKFIGVIKQSQTNVVWRTTTSIYRAENKTHKRFQTYQRALLFNAYAMTAMCKANLPIIDVFPITSSYPMKPVDGIHFTMELFEPMQELLKKYYEYLEANISLVL